MFTEIDGKNSPVRVRLLIPCGEVGVHLGRYLLQKLGEPVSMSPLGSRKLYPKCLHFTLVSGIACELVKKKAGRRIIAEPPPNSPLGHFTLSQSLLGPSIRGKTLATGDCSQARYGIVFVEAKRRIGQNMVKYSPAIR